MELLRDSFLGAGLALVDLDGTIREPKSNNQFINTPLDQQLIPGINEVLSELNQRNFAIYGVSNQGGIVAGYKTLRDTIKEMRYFLKLCPYLNRIYFSYDDDHVWVVTRQFPILDWFPLLLNTFSRYTISGTPFDDSKYWLGGFRKPNPGMLRMAIADWSNRYKLLNGFIEPLHWLKGWYAFFDTYEIVTKTNFYYKYFPEKLIFMVGDRDEDRQAAEKCGVKFVHAELFQKGFVPYGLMQDEKK